MQRPPDQPPHPTAHPIAAGIQRQRRMQRQRRTAWLEAEKRDKADRIPSTSVHAAPNGLPSLGKRQSRP